jgi:RNA polymerase sigma-70 factor (ECF subfamily)
MKTAITNIWYDNPDISDELVQRCKKGDHKAQLQIYKLFYKPVFRSCLQLVNDPEVAEDIMQESFLLAFENINTYIGDISFSNWVKKFIRNVLYNPRVNVIQ